MNFKIGQYIKATQPTQLYFGIPDDILVITDLMTDGEYVMTNKTDAFIHKDWFVPASKEALQEKTAKLIDIVWNM